MFPTLSPRARRTIALAACALATPLGALAQAAWPTRSVTLVVSYAPGGGADLIARLLAPKMSQALGQPVVVENKAGGAAGQIGASHVARSAPDGYTVLVDAGSFAINPSLYPKLPYNAAKDFTAIGVAAKFPHVLVVNPAVKATNATEFVHLAKSSELFYASSGNGSSQHIAGALFIQSTGIKMTHVPYKGGGPAMVDVMSGAVPSFFGNVASALPQVQSGKLKALGIAGATRVPGLPNVPTMQEQGIKGTEVYEWNGLFVPAGTPAAVVDRLADAVDKALAAPDVRERILALGGEPFQGGRAAAARFVAAETQRMADIVHAANIKPNE